MSHLTGRYLGLMLLAVTAAFGADEEELWVQASQQAELRPGLPLSLTESARFRGDGTGLYHWYGEGGVTLKLAAGWSLQPAVRIARLKSTSGRWSSELRGALAVGRKLSLGPLDVAIRGRVEYRDYSARADGWWLRGRLVVAPGAGWKKSWKPYASEEVFHEFDSGRLRQNRFFLGATCPLGRGVSGNVFTGWRSSERAGRWTHQRILGLKADWKF